MVRGSFSGGGEGRDRQSFLCGFHLGCDEGGIYYRSQSMLIPICRKEGEKRKLARNGGAEEIKIAGPSPPFV